METLLYTSGRSVGRSGGVVSASSVNFPLSARTRNVHSREGALDTEWDSTRQTQRMELAQFRLADATACQTATRAVACLIGTYLHFFPLEIPSNISPGGCHVQTEKGSRKIDSAEPRNGEAQSLRAKGTSAMRQSNAWMLISLPKRIASIRCVAFSHYLATPRPSDS